MAIRDNLKSNLDVSLSGSNVAVSSELPYTTGGEALYNKNMKKLYLDEDNISKTEMINCLDNNDVIETETTVTGFLSVDAKNQPGDIDTIVANIINSRNSISSQVIRECEMTTENTDDVITYTFDFRFVTV
jgi:hypothetical protein